MDDPIRRKQIALYCLVRALSDLVRLAVHYKKLPLIPHTDVGIFTLSQIFIMHGLVHASNALDKKYYKWIKNMGNLTEEQCQYSFRSRINPKLQYRLPSEEWHQCHPFFHKDPSCLRHNAIDWVYGLSRAARIYLPVHFLPTILFEPKRIFQEPLLWLKKKGWNVMVSSIFLTTYQFNMKYTICKLRNWCKDDLWWHGPAGGFMTGIALFIENERRRPELVEFFIEF